jgi:hypothetical protein
MHGYTTRNGQSGQETNIDRSQDLTESPLTISLLSSVNKGGRFSAEYRWERAPAAATHEPWQVYYWEHHTLAESECLSSIIINLTVKT